jgi:exopolysaccharide production protein ExoQ
MSLSFFDKYLVLSLVRAFEIEPRRGRELGLDLCQIVACSTLFLLLLYFFGIVELFIEPSSSLNRFFVFSASACSVMILLTKLPLAARLLHAAWPWLLIVAWLALTTRFAGYPDLSRTRVLAFAMVYLAALGMAAGLRSPRTLTTILIAVFAVVIFADIVSLDFDTSYTDIGVRGIHKHKNAAGFVAVLAFIITAFAFPQVRSFGLRATAGCVLLASVAILIVTKSKTNLGLAAIVICLIPMYSFCIRFTGHRLLYLLMTAVACTLLFVAGASGTKISKVGGVLFGDPTLTNRMAIWAAVEEVIAQAPWRGQGFGSIWDVGEEWNSLPGAEGYVFYNDADLINEAHNGYLDLMLNGGRVALVLCWLVTLRALWFAVVLATSRIVPISQRWGFCMLHCLVTIMLVHNVTESSVFFPGSHNTYFFIFLVGQVERWKVEFDAHREAWHGAGAA